MLRVPIVPAGKVHVKKLLCHRDGHGALIRDVGCPAQAPRTRQARGIGCLGKARLEQIEDADVDGESDHWTENQNSQRGGEQGNACPFRGRPSAL